MSTHSDTSAWPVAGRVVVATLLLLYDLLALFVASAWGPGNSDELVTGGIELIPWYGLPVIAFVACVTSLACVSWPRVSRRAAAIAAASLIAWTAFALLVAG